MSVDWDIIIKAKEKGSVVILSLNGKKQRGVVSELDKDGLFLFSDESGQKKWVSRYNAESIEIINTMELLLENGKWKELQEKLKRIKTLLDDLDRSIEKIAGPPKK